MKHLAFLLATLPLLVACQSLWTDDSESNDGLGARWQGIVSLEEGRLWFSPCQEQRRLPLKPTPEIEQTIRELMADSGQSQLFADLNAQSGQETGSLVVTQFQRFSAPTPQSCLIALDPQQPSLSASSNNPSIVWNLSISQQGMLLEIPHQTPKAIPYLEEQLPGGRISFSSDINGQHIELWITPQKCFDGITTTLTSLSATLHVDQQQLSGCAYFGRHRLN